MVKTDIKSSPKFKDPKKKHAPVRSKVRQNENQALLKLQGVNDSHSAGYYNGKKVVYLYKAQTLKNNTKYRICKPHGGNGTVIARFAKNLPPKAMGATLRVMLYPNRFNFDMASCPCINQ